MKKKQPQVVMVHQIAGPMTLVNLVEAGKLGNGPIIGGVNKPCGRIKSIDFYTYNLRPLSEIFFNECGEVERFTGDIGDLQRMFLTDFWIITPEKWNPMKDAFFIQKFKSKEMGNFTSWEPIK